MKLATTLIALPLLAVSLSGHAEPSHSEPSFCNIIYDLAESIMTSRQNGVPMPKMIEVAKGHDLSINLTQQAYLHSRFSTYEYQQRAIRDFANGAYGRCLSAFSNN